MPKLKRGDQAPAFTLPDQNGNKVRLSDFRGAKLLLYFYPKAGTSADSKLKASGTPWRSSKS